MDLKDEQNSHPVPDSKRQRTTPSKGGESAASLSFTKLYFN